MRHEPFAEFDAATSSERRKRLPQWCAWALGSAFIVYLFVNEFFRVTRGAGGKVVYWGGDFINLWIGGGLVRQGRFDVLNHAQAFFAYEQGLLGHIDFHNYSYPPVSYPLAAAFSYLPYSAALVAWIACTAALFIYACRRWWPASCGPMWLAALTPAALVNVWDGQYGFVVGALFLLGWQWLDEHPRRAGIAFGLMLIKPHLAVLIPIALLVRRRWGTLASGAATVLALVGGTTLLFGWNSWADFFVRTGPLQASMIDGRGKFFGFMSTSTSTALMSLGVGWTLAVTAQVIAALTAIAMVCIAAHRRTPVRELAFLVATCTFLVLPYAFNYDLTVVAVGALALMATRRLTDLEYLAAVFGFVCASIGMFLTIVGCPVMPLMIAALALAQFHRWVVVPWRTERLAPITKDLQPSLAEDSGRLGFL